MNHQKRRSPAADQANRATLENEQINYSNTDQELCSGYGQYHSPNAEKNPRPLETVRIAQIEALAKNPNRVNKQNAQWFIPSTLLSRSHIDQLAGGDFWALWADIDEVKDEDFESVCLSVASLVCPSKFIAYTSRSATEDNQKTRIIFPMSAPVSGSDWKLLQKILNDKLAEIGVIPDRVSERTGQLCYLPNRGSYYAYYIKAGALFDPSQWASDLETERNRLQEEESTQKAIAEQASLKPRPTTGEQAGIIERVKQAYPDSEQILIANGYRKISKRYLSPHSESGTPGVIILDNGKVYSHHSESDPLSNLNHGGHALDVFDIICTLRFSGDFSRAVRELANELDLDGQKQRQRDYMAAQDTPKADINALFEDSEETEPQPLSQSSVDLMSPPGLAGEICKLMQMKARRPCPDLYPFAALHLMALIGRKRRSVYTDKLNLMTLAIAPTAAGKEKAQDIVKRLASDHYCSKLIHGNAGSFKDLIYNLLDGDGSSLYIVDEVHSLLGSMKDKNAATYETKMEAEILTMNSTELYTFRGMEKRSLISIYEKEVKQLEAALEATIEDSEKYEHLERAKRRLDWLQNGLPAPFFSMMGHSVPERLDSFIRLENISSGFLGRTLVTRCPDTRAKLRRNPVDQHEVALIEMNIDRGLRAIRSSREEVTATPEAEDYLNDCIDWYEEDEQLNHHIAGGIYARAPEHLVKIASILALEDGAISLEHARYADAMVKQSIKDISYILLKAYSESDGAEEAQVLRHARQTIHRNCKGLGQTESRVKQLVTKPKGWQEMQSRDVTRDRFKELIDSMLAENVLTVQENGRRRRILSQAVV